MAKASLRAFDSQVLSVVVADVKSPALVELGSIGHLPRKLLPALDLGDAGGLEPH